MNADQKNSDKKIKIYTKTGDGGQTRLVDGRECSKANLRVETYGTVDELNSVLGILIAHLHGKVESQLVQHLTAIQNQLFNIGSHLACEKDETRKMLPALDEDWIKIMEDKIDEMTAELEPLRNFILPGGSLPASYSHLGRTVCRRAERMVVRLIEDSDSPANQAPEILRSLRYLNRLSDYLFVLGRFINHTLKVEDQLWTK